MTDLTGSAFLFHFFVIVCIFAHVFKLGILNYFQYFSFWCALNVFYDLPIVFVVVVVR